MINPFVMTKLMINARRAPLTRTPAEVGLEFEDAAFPAADGVGLKGWFIPSGRPEPGPAVVFVHGWMWNRLGNVAHQVKGLKDADVDFLPAAKGLHDAGFHVLLFDVRWHGESEPRPEAADLRAGRGARLHRRRALPALAPRGRRRADRRDRHLDGRQHRHLRNA